VLSIYASREIVPLRKAISLHRQALDEDGLVSSGLRWWGVCCGWAKRTAGKALKWML